MNLKQALPICQRNNMNIIINLTKKIVKITTKCMPEVQPFPLDCMPSRN